MTGFCSCKTGIHAIPGNNLGAKTQARIQHRHWPLSDFLSFAAPAHPCALKRAENAAAPSQSSPAFDYTDNGMDPLHFLTGLIRAKMEFHINHLEMEWINNEDYNHRP